MARDVTGTGTILKASRTICRMVGRFGVVKLQAATSAEYTNAVVALVAACQVLDAVDNYVATIDRSPGGTGDYDEDVPVSAGAGSLINELIESGSGT